MKNLKKILFLLVLIICFTSQNLKATEIVEENLKPLKTIETTEVIEEIETINLENVFSNASKHFKTPVIWSKAIAKVESGLKPWVLNIEGKGYFFDSKTEALKEAEKAFKANKSFDTGLMQINSWWLKKYNIPLEAALDPEANVYLGNFILAEEIKKHGLNNKAIGAYHSPTKEKANNYTNIVLKAIEKNANNKVKLATPSNGSSYQVKNKITNKNSKIQKPKKEEIQETNNRNILAYSSKKAILKSETENLKITPNNENSMKIVMNKKGE